MRRRMDWLLVLIFMLVLASVVAGMFALRRSVMDQLDSSQAQGGWDEWRAATNQMVDEGVGAGGVARRAAASPVPPALILLQSHFAACLLGVVATVSVPLAVLLFISRGLILQRTRLTREGAARQSIEEL